MATKKKPGKKVVSTAKAAGKKVGKKVVKKAQGLLDRIAQRSAQLVLDSGLLGEVPPAKKKAGKRATKKKSRKA